MGHVPYLEFTTIRSSYFVAPCSGSTGLFLAKELRIAVNSKYGATMSQYGATKVAVEILIAQINAQYKLATLSREIRKIRYGNEI
jgi:hypothetical protein